MPPVPSSTLFAVFARAPRCATTVLAITALTLSAQSPLRAATILANDNFTASGGAGINTVAHTSSTDVGTYTTLHGTNGMSVKPVADFGEGNVLALSNTTNTYYRAFDNAAVLKLSELPVSQTLSLTFDIRFDGGTFGAAQNFSFGFVNATTANSVLYANVNLNGGSSEFRYRPDSTNMSDAGTQLPSSGWVEPATVSAKSYTFQLDVTRNADGGYLFQYYRNSQLLGSITQTAGSTWARLMAGEALTGIAFRHSQVPALVTYIDTVSLVIMPAATPATTAGAAVWNRPTAD